MPIEQLLKSLVRDVHDFPKPGIVFKDITPLLANPEATREVVVALANQYRGTSLDAVAGVEARGFIFGTLLAQELRIPFVPIRKSGKLPCKKIEQQYALEYGFASIEMHEDAIQEGWKVLIHDDLLATGGTSVAAAQLIQRLNGIVAGFSFIINLGFLPGEGVLTKRFGVVPQWLMRVN